MGIVGMWRGAAVAADIHERLCRRTSAVDLPCRSPTEREYTRPARSVTVAVAPCTGWRSDSGTTASAPADSLELRVRGGSGTTAAARARKSLPRRNRGVPETSRTRPSASDGRSTRGVETRKRGVATRKRCVATRSKRGGWLQLSQPRGIDEDDDANNRREQFQGE